MIVAVFKDNDDYTKAYGLWQWDYGQELRIQGLNLPTAVEIHFALQETGGEALTRIGVTKDGITTVPIPDSMLEGEGVAYEYHIYAWIYLSDTKTGETIKRIDMPVKARSKPEPFDTPEAGELFAEAIEAVNEAADRAEKAGAEAVKVGEEAKEAAAKAGEHLEAVQSLAGQVEINADAVAQDKQAVAGMVTQTQHAASEAALSAQAAKQSQIAAEQAQAGAEIAANAAREHAEGAEADRQAVTEAKREVTQMRQEVANDRQAVEGAIAGFDGAVNQAVGEITAAGETQVAAVNTAGQTAVQAVNTAKGEAVKAVEAEGTEQAGIVAAEGAKQLGEIEQVMATIPEDYTALSELADSNYRNKAPGIVETATGELIEIKDGSELPVQGLVVYGRSTQRATTGAQLFDGKNDYSTGKGTINGVEISYEESTLKIKGTASANVDIHVKGEFIKSLPHGTYTASIDKVIDGLTMFYNDSQTVLNGSNKITFNYDGNFSYFIMRISGGKTVNESIDLMLNAGSTALPYEPYTNGKPSPSIENPQEINIAGEGGEIGLNITGGRNLADPICFSEADKYYQTEDDLVTQVVNDDSPEQSKHYISMKKGKYIISILGDIKGSMFQIYVKKNDTYSQFTYGKLPAILNLNEDCEISYKLYGATQYPISFKLQIEPGNNAQDYTPYEPYKSQSITLPTPTGLPGISVTSGGNYTDSDGQQWVCDTMEYDANGQSNYVQRVNKLTDSDLTLAKVVSGDAVNQYIYSVFEYDTESYIARDIPVLCNKFIYGKKGEINTVDYRTLKDAGWGGKSRMTFNVEKSITKELFETEILPTLDIIVPIPNPIRTPLSTEQVAALKQLHTFHPTTIITNDAGVDVSVDYVADTKTYIDNQFAQLNKTILDAVIGGK